MSTKTPPDPEPEHLSFRCRIYLEQGQAHSPCSGTCDKDHGNTGSWCGQPCQCPICHPQPPAEHTVALVSMWLPGHDLTDTSIRAQCECGWFAHFESPITLKRVNQVVREHPR
jgi:hypothetical protein